MIGRALVLAGFVFLGYWVSLSFVPLVPPKAKLATFRPSALPSSSPLATRLDELATMLERIEPGTGSEQDAVRGSALLAEIKRLNAVRKVEVGKLARKSGNGGGNN